MVVNYNLDNINVFKFPGPEIFYYQNVKQNNNNNKCGH